MYALTTLAVGVYLLFASLVCLATQQEQEAPTTGEPAVVSEQETPETWTWETVPPEDIIYFYDFTLLRRLKLGTAPLVNPELLERVETGYIFNIPENGRHWACEQSEEGLGLIGITNEAEIIAFEPGDIPCAEADQGIWAIEGANSNVFISPSPEINAPGFVERSENPVITWDSHGIAWGSTGTGMSN